MSPAGWPAPEVGVRDAAAHHLPTAARSLLVAAQAHGWASKATYARGTAPDRYGEPGEVVDSIVVRLQRGPVILVATWWDKRFHSGWLKTPGLTPVPLGARALKSVVQA